VRQLPAEPLLWQCCMPSPASKRRRAFIVSVGAVIALLCLGILHTHDSSVRAAGGVPVQVHAGLEPGRRPNGHDRWREWSSVFARLRRCKLRQRRRWRAGGRRTWLLGLLRNGGDRHASAARRSSPPCCRLPAHPYPQLAVWLPE